jgi:hypothetical protein
MSLLHNEPNHRIEHTIKPLKKPFCKQKALKNLVPNPAAGITAFFSI